MKHILRILIIGLFYISCNDSSNKTGKGIESSNESPIVTNSRSTSQESAQKTSKKATIDDCIFDLKTQTDDFIKNIPEFSNYIWNDSTKTGIIALENGEKLIAKRGGCDHFGISGQWIQKNKKHTIEEIDYWFEQGKWISKRILTDTDYSELEKMMQEKRYDLNFGEDAQLYVNFKGHNYSEWYLSLNWDFENGNDNVIIETGYYFD